jgi:integrase
VLADWELRLAFKAAEELGRPFGPLIKLLILTGQRLKELADADWSELDRTEGVFAIPAARAKNKRPTDVPHNVRFPETDVRNRRARRCTCGVSFL